MTKNKISWILYLVGSLLVFGSWINLVPTGLAWLGWLMAIIGWAWGNSGKQPITTSPRVDEIAKLDLLRREGVVTEEEFQQEKERILRQP